mmetsp:Transcript_5723/g.13307  ORF Transcript_5723/g.13307 Transcript_5723/m.13307 type:complete len:258 (-) Transcript_5723:59-832(-)
MEYVNVYSCLNQKKVDKSEIPNIFFSKIRVDIVRFVHKNMCLNRRQPYAVSSKAGMGTSAKSWGTGRAVARVPRIPGSGTHRSGQGAIANFCRGGRMFSPTTTWRKWHHKINKNQRKTAIISALASTSIISLIISRGFKLKTIPEIPFVIENAIEKLYKTKDAIRMLKNTGLYEIIKNRSKKKINAGKAKMRNRRFKKPIGPLLILTSNLKSFRTIPTIDLMDINALNLIKLAPGGHVGRLCVWSSKAFNMLNKLLR